MTLAAWAAWVYLPFVLPICVYVAFTDMREMRITNQAVLALAALFVVLGLVTLPLPEYGLRLAQGVIVLIIGIILNAAGAVGAGDAKFIAAAAPYVPREDGLLVLMIYAAALLAGYVAHRIAKHTRLRSLAPDWQSWSMGKKFPMGLALGGTLAIYLVLGTIYGA